MKLLTDDNLYFDASLLNGSLNTEVKYYMTRKDLDNNNQYLYFGTIFYYSNNQKIYYDHLLNNIDMDFVDTSYIHNTKVSGTKYVSITATNLPLFVIKIDTITCVEDYGERDKYLRGDPATNTSAHILRPDIVEEPRYVYNQNNLPIFIWNSKATADTTTHYLDCSTGGSSTTHTYTLKSGSNNYYDWQCNIDPAHNVILRKDSTVEQTVSYTGVCAPYCLVWWDNAGFWQSLPFWGTFSDNYTNNEITNMQNYTSKYETQVEKSWNLKSDYIKKQRTYQSLFTSKLIYLFDAVNPIYKDNQYGYFHLKVLVSDSNFQESLQRKAHRFEITVKLDKNYVSR